MDRERKSRRKRNSATAAWVIAAVLAVCLAISVGVNAYFVSWQKTMEAEIERLREGDAGTDSLDLEAEEDEDEESGEGAEDIETEEDPYAGLTDSLPEEGESVSYTLSSGNYIVGVHIPEGYYTAEAGDDSDYVGISDLEHDIFLDTSAGDEPSYMNDLRLFSGAELEIQTTTSITVTSDNAQTQDMEGMANPLTQSVELEAGESKSAGSDFDPGVYDVRTQDGAGTVQIEIYDEDEDLVYYAASLYMDGSDGKSYANLVLPKGAEVSCDEDVSITLSPSEVIESTDYEAYYDRIPG